MACRRNDFRHTNCRIILLSWIRDSEPPTIFTLNNVYVCLSAKIHVSQVERCGIRAKPIFFWSKRAMKSILNLKQLHATQKYVQWRARMS
jgi:hypothetical protein